MKFERPTRHNVELGDILVLSSANGTNSKNVGLVRILSLKEKTLVYDKGYSSNNFFFDNEVDYRYAVVLKKDGTYLVGNFASFDYEE